MLMKRFIVEFDSKELKKEKFDLVIIGTGLAGLSAAYSASRISPEKQIAVITKSALKESSSFNAQGGIAVALGKKDSWRKHASDTIKCGAELCDKKNVKILTEEGISRVKELIKLGLEFDSKNNEFAFGREAAHSINRILHINGDGTGEGLIKFMRSLAKEQKNIQLMKESYMIDLLVKKQKAEGILVEQNGEKKIIQGNAIVIATGGYSSLFEKTTNPEHSIGEGISIAYRAGATIADLEFVQFHPTTLAVKDERNFLISEAVRGEGALIVNEIGKRIMEDVDGRKELAPRDIVSRMVYRELMNGKKVFLDCTRLGEAFLRKGFPMIFEKTNSLGINMGTDLIPIEPAAHYCIGGILANSHGETNIKGLYTCGESSCTKVHGANRLASNSLLEAVVFGFRTGEKAIKEKQKKFTEFKNKCRKKEGMVFEKELKQIMWKHCGVERNEKSLGYGLNALQEIEKEVIINDSIESYQMQNKILLQTLIMKSALKRKESRGVHYRTDYPKNSSAWKKHSVIKKNAG